MSERKRITLNDIAVILTIVGLVSGLIWKWEASQTASPQPASPSSVKK